MKDKITGLLDNGDELFKEEKYLEAMNFYQEAKDGLSVEQLEEHIVDINTSIADVLYMIGEYEEALTYFRKIIAVDGMENNSFISLRIGQCLNEIGQIDKGKFYLLKAYELDGVAVFEGASHFLELLDDIL